MLTPRHIAALFIFLVLLPSVAFSRDLLDERGWLEDETGHMTLEQARAAEFHPFNGILAHGYSENAIWVRLVSRARTPTAEDRGDGIDILRIRPIYLDEVEVYDSLFPGGPIARVGDRIHPSEGALRTLDLAVPVTHPEVGRTFYLRLKTTSTRALFIELRSEVDYLRLAQRRGVIFTLLLTFSIVFFLGATAQFLISRDPLFGAFALQQAISLLLGAANYGQLRLFWPDGLPATWLDMTTNLGVCFAASVAIQFERLLLSSLGISQFSKRLLLGLLMLLPVELGLMLAGQISLALFLNMVQISIAPVLFLLIALSATGWRKPPNLRPALPRLMIIAYHVALILSILLTAAPALGFGSGNEWSLYSSLWYFLLSGTMMFAMLLYRSEVLRRRDANLTVELAASRREVEVAQRHSSERAKLIAVLSHELNTPLSVVRMLIDGETFHPSALPKIESVVADMAQIIRRCTMSERTDDGAFALEPECVDVAALLRRIILDTREDARVALGGAAAEPIVVDPEILRIVLANLIENALKYSPPGSPIRIDLSATDTPRRIRIVVANGPGNAGFPDPARLFAKFYRAPAARRLSGSGLGLYIAYELTQRLGGNLEYDHNPIEIRFVLTLGPVAA